MKEEVKNIFQKSYAGHESPVDPAEIWAGIESKRDNKKPTMIWILLLGLVLVGGILSLALISPTDSLSTDVVNEDQIETSRVKPLNTRREEKQKVLPNAMIEEKKSSQVAIKSNKSKTSESQSKSVSLNPQSQMPLNLQIDADKSNALVQPARPTQIIASHQNRSASKSDDQLDEGPFILKSTLRESIPKQEVPKSIVEMTKLSLLPNMQSLLRYDSTHSLEDALIESKLFKSLKGSFTLDLFLGAGIFSQQYLSADADYNNLRMNTETPLESLHAGVLLGYQFKRIGVSTGIHYIRFNSKTETILQFFGTAEASHLSNYDSNSFDQSLIGTATSEKVSLFKQLHIRYNEIETYSVPVLVNYRLSLGKLKVEPNIGLQFHLIQSIKESVLSPNGELSLQNESSTQVKFDKVGGINLYYPIQPTVQLGFKIQGMQREIEDNDAKRSVVGYQFGLGLRYLIK